MQNEKKLTNREKALIGVAIVSTCVAGYFGHKYLSGTKVKELMFKDIGRLDEQIMSLEDSIDTLKAAMEETGRI